MIVYSKVFGDISMCPEQLSGCSGHTAYCSMVLISARTLSPGKPAAVVLAT